MSMRRGSVCTAVEYVRAFLEVVELQTFLTITAVYTLQLQGLLHCHQLQTFGTVVWYVLNLTLFRLFQTF